MRIPGQEEIPAECYTGQVPKTSFSRQKLEEKELSRRPNTPTSLKLQNEKQTSFSGEKRAYSMSCFDIASFFMHTNTLIYEEMKHNQRYIYRGFRV